MSSSLTLRRIALLSPYSGPLHHLLLTLASIADADGDAKITIPDLAGIIGLCDRQVRRHLRRLEKDGEIAASYGGGRGDGSTYHLVRYAQNPDINPDIRISKKAVNPDISIVNSKINPDMKPGHASVNVRVYTGNPDIKGEIFDMEAACHHSPPSPSHSPIPPTGGYIREAILTNPSILPEVTVDSRADRVGRTDMEGREGPKDRVRPCRLSPIEMAAYLDQCFRERSWYRDALETRMRGRDVRNPLLYRYEIVWSWMHGQGNPPLPDNPYERNVAAAAPRPQGHSLGRATTAEPTMYRMFRGSSG